LNHAISLTGEQQVITISTSQLDSTLVDNRCKMQSSSVVKQEAG